MAAPDGCVYTCTLDGGGDATTKAWLDGVAASLGCEEDRPPTVQELAGFCPTAVPRCAAYAPCLRELQAALASDADIGPGSDLFNAIGHCMFSKEACGENEYLCWMDDSCRAVMDMPGESADVITANQWRVTNGQQIGDHWVLGEIGMYTVRRILLLASCACLADVDNRRRCAGPRLHAEGQPLVDGLLLHGL